MLVLSLAEDPGGNLDVACGIADEYRVDRIGHIKLGAIAMGGHQHAADGIDERSDPIAEKFRAHGKTQGRQVLFAAQGR
ncbi:hypothetical protein D3C73_1363620 [compost metagenome]